MEFDEGLGIILWVLLIVAVIVLIVDYRKGKRGLVMTVGWIIFGLGIAGDVPLPTIAPGLANFHSKASLLTSLGLLLILGSWLASWWTTRKNKREV